MYKLLAVLLCGSVLLSAAPLQAEKIGRLDKKLKRKMDQSARRALDWLAKEQRPQGFWEANQGQYRIAMTALAGMAFLCEGSTTMSGRYRDNIRKAVSYLVDSARPNGLIGYQNDYRYTYGHGFSMLFLSQVYGDEEDPDRRKQLRKVLINAVKFSVNAQTSRGGWGYVSAKDGNDFDEGSTCVTQVQGLRACRNAGIPVPKTVIDRAQKYIHDCTIKTGPYAGGIVYSYTSRGSARPPISAAAVAVMFSTGEYKTKQVQSMLAYCRKYVWPGQSGRITSNYGHWHYAHYYYSQVMFRLGGEKEYAKDWQKYASEVCGDIMKKQSADGSWRQGYIGPVYTTAINATILQLHKGYVPIYQR